MITVFTPTYNRAKFLPRLYESLCKQTCQDFEWVIVDDGSKDETRNIIASFHNGNVNANGNNSPSMGGGLFPIRYFYQENGGKHRAINRGVKEAKGELFLILDSDDTLPPHSLEIINRYYQQIKEETSFGGVCGYMAHHDGVIIGHGCDADILDANSIDLRFKYHVQGDMLEVFRTSVMREFPFPEIKGEKFVPEMLVWNRIAGKYKLRVFHEVVYYRDYIDGGLTDKIVKIRMNSPIASMITYAEQTRYKGVPIIAKIKAAINYWRFRFCSDNKKNPQLSWWYYWTMPLGFLMHLRDLKSVK